MLDTMVAQATLKNKRFVPATDYDAGRALYYRGMRQETCINDEQRRGWQAEWERGRDAYWRCMAMEGAA